MRWIVSLVIPSVLSFLFGVFYGGSVPRIIKFQRSAPLQEVRDSYNRKCVAEGASLRGDGKMEELWSCNQMKVFLIKEWVKVSSD